MNNVYLHPTATNPETIRRLQEMTGRVGLLIAGKAMLYKFGKSTNRKTKQ